LIFVGLSDYSPEEIRLEAYKAKESGTFDEYLQSISQLHNKFAMRKKELASLTLSSWEQERRNLSNQNSSGLFTSQPTTSNPFSTTPQLFSSQSSQSSNAFGNTQSKTLFGSSSSGQLLFGQQPSSASGQSVFGQQAISSGQSVFGQQPSSASGQSVFGQQTNSSFGQTTFGQQANSSSGHSFFGQQSKSTSGHSIFGQQTSSAKISLFGSHQSSPFGNGKSSLFGSASFSNLGAKQQTSVFGSVQHSVASGSQQTSLALFGARVQTVNEGSSQPAFGELTSGFQGQQIAPGSGQMPSLQVGQQSTAIGQAHPAVVGQQSIVGGGLFSKGEQQTGQGLFTQSSLFGRTAQQPSSLFSQPTNAVGNAPESLVQEPQSTPVSGTSNPFLQASIQTRQEEIANSVPDVPSVLKVSEKDLAAFKADRFVVGQIPECPPPLEFC